MRIEKRGGVECLVGVETGPNACREKFDGTHRTICTHHLDGEHISLGGHVDDDAYRIDARWPIEPGSASPEPTSTAESSATRFLTPDEVRVAQAPHVLAAIERINAELASGVRSFAVNEPLFEEIKRGLQEAGWTVLGATTANGRTSFGLREKKGGEG
jgi:hypothetical protein